MRIEIAKTPQAAAESIAARIIKVLTEKPDAVLGLATGATMEPVYQALIAAHRRGEVSFAQAMSFNLDEYCGLSPTHPGSYRATMNRLLFDHVDIDHSRTFVPDGAMADPVLAAADYEERIAGAGGIDLQLLGIGRNGHIGFNEPGSAFDSHTRQVSLHPETLKANQGFFADGSVPHHAITMGIATILAARSILVLATGGAKSTAVSQAIEGPVSAECPASALQQHGDVCWVMDTAAAGGLSRAKAS
ncbi:glucosamine-6-phosphate deaminase [Allorhizobium sp. BGMRC 0089]|uniref:glucosamine-6-phosphate deaminase n=1 Tax=Allorhizobium sonneratiae TaxID=2934936 RepID=UPI0020336CFA|nr:glucosamine-6-phosphate deaminase [Allorhizobium sonneratiae]MCM2293281.1 glucosamine-6-phosphate deaminase [Allorhizobium sonneratiae]